MNDDFSSGALQCSACKLRACITSRSSELIVRRHRFPDYRNIHHLFSRFVGCIAVGFGVTGCAVSAAPPPQKTVAVPPKKTSSIPRPPAKLLAREPAPKCTYTDEEPAKPAKAQSAEGNGANSAESTPWNRSIAVSASVTASVTQSIRSGPSSRRPQMAVSCPDLVLIRLLIIRFRHPTSLQQTLDRFPPLARQLLSGAR